MKNPNILAILSSVAAVDSSFPGYTGLLHVLIAREINEGEILVAGTRIGIPYLLKTMYTSVSEFLRVTKIATVCKSANIYGKDKLISLLITFSLLICNIFGMIVRRES
ncbi:hypothetical protein CFP56_026184 [Quercus suber]|uniref:Uncharacterized protein n=1 Tax=Quercus suber TaxID=58331 RepID=A0AAW0K2V3_QUESU